MVASNDRFWAKVLFREYIRHYRKMTDEQIVNDVRQSMDDLEELVEDSPTFGSKMVKWSMQRQQEPPAIASRENGKQGGRPRKNTEGAANGNNADCDHSRESAATGSTTASGRGCNTGITSPVVSLESGKNSGSAKSQNDKRRAGGVSPLSVSTSSSPSARSGAVDVLNLAYAGEFGNVKLTQEQYAQLGIKFGNQQKLNRAIDSLSCQIENGEKNPQNHYAELVKWAAYRDDMDERKEEEESKPKMTNMEKSWIAAMKRVEAM